MENEQVHREDPLRLGLLAMLSPGIAWADDSHILGAVREVLGSRAEAIRLATMRLDDLRADEARHKATRDELAALRVALTRETVGGAPIADELAIKEVRWLRERADASEEAWRDVRALRTRLAEVLAPVASEALHSLTGDQVLIDEVAALVQAHRDAERDLEALRRAPAVSALRLSLVAALPSLQGWTPTDADIVAEVAGLVAAVRSVAADEAADADGLDALLEAMGTTEEMTIGEAAEQVRTHLRTVDRYHALRAELVDAIGERDSARDPDIVARVEWLAKMHRAREEAVTGAPSDTWRTTAEEMGDEAIEAHELLDAVGVPWGEDDEAYGAELLPRIAWLVGARDALRGGV